MSEHVDVLIVGAGISGIGSAYHLLDQRPGTTFTILETKETFGGTWDTHRYPGIRSDSDLFTFGYRFKPWTGTPIATGDEILKYVGEVIDENQLDQYIRYSHTITSASWSSETQTWTIQATNPDGPVVFTAGFLWMCQGYYRHTEPYTPSWDGMDDFEGTIVHPQVWPEDLDVADKKVVVIGSGATAATLIPNLADDCAHVTMLQRSPTFFITGRNSNDLAEELRELEIPDEWTHEIVRRKVLKEQREVARASAEEPELVRAFLLDAIRQELGDDYDVETHFNPRYRPWQQRIAFVPDADLFRGIASGKASVVTDEIDRFVPQGIALTSGEVLEADLIVTATGFDLSVLGGIEFCIDDQPLDFADTVTYRGLMFTGMPNLVWVFGYFRASWTLRVDLIGDFVCRLLDHMDELGAGAVVPSLRDADAGMALGGWVDPDDFNPGYLMRSMHLMPKQGDRPPWLHTQDYWLDRQELPDADLDDGALRFTPRV